MFKKINQIMSSKLSVSMDILLTGGTNIAIVLLTFLSYGIVARLYNVTELSEYMMNRRLAAQILPFFVLCMPMALCRYLPLAKDDALKRINYTIITTGLILLISVLFSIIILVFHDFFSNLFFNKQAGPYEILGLTLLVLGAVLIEHLSAYFRGRLWIKLSNLLVLICTGIIPILVVLILKNSSVYNLIYFTGLAWILTSAVFAYIVIKNIFSYKISLQNYIKNNSSFFMNLKEIINYSLSRIPGILCMSIIWIISPILLTHLDRIDKSAIILAGLQFLNVAVLPLRPISYVFFPLFSEYKAYNKQREISVLSSLVSSLAAVVGIYFTLHFIVLAPIILELWLNIKGLEATITISILLLCMAPYMCFEINRNIIDTYFDQPYITFITVVSLILMIAFPFLLVFFGLNAIYSVAIGSAIAFVCLGIISDYIVKHMIIKKELIIDIKNNLIINIIYILISTLVIFLFKLVLSKISIVYAFAILAIIEIILFYGFMWINIKQKTTWIMEIVTKYKLQKVFIGAV